MRAFLVLRHPVRLDDAGIMSIFLPLHGTSEMTRTRLLGPLNDTDVDE